MRNQSLQGLALLALLTALTACGAAPAATAPRCAVEVAPVAVPGAEPRYRLVEGQSQPHCTINQVVRQYEEGEAWFNEQTSGTTYGSELLALLPRYYGEPLLHETSEMLYHHQREGMVVVGQWRGRSLTGDFWSPDGATVTLRYEVEGYELLVHGPDGPEPERHQTSAPLEYWFVTMAYDPGAGRWKAHAIRVEPPTL